MKRIFFLFFLFANVACAQQNKLPENNTVSIIPQPVTLQMGNGKFSISKNTVIAVSDEEDKKAAHFFNSFLKEVYGFKLDIDKQEGKDYIRLSTKKFIQAPEKDAYRLNVSSEGVVIEGDTYAGTFYGIQTLIQLLPAYDIRSLVDGKDIKVSSLIIPYVTIEDYPRFNYRGLHLDVARHFSPVSYIKKYIDYIALHKMNYFHWHLTDDQGWRIEVKRYPKLKEIAAYRNGTIVGRYPGTANDNIKYGGYYTQEEIREVVAYAANRHITVIPEIEMPGHSSAAIAAYPELSCFPEKETNIPSHPSEASKKMTGKKVQETWSIFEDIFCAGKENTFEFLQNVIDEVLSLFPSQYIHIGGDEAPKTHWKQCPDCQKRIKDHKLKDEHELQSYFIQRMETYLNSKGRTLIGWDEILDGGLAPNAVVMSWRGETGGIAAARQNHYVIMTPGSHVYFDYSQSRNEDSVVIGGYTPIEKVYSYEPIPKELNAEQSKFVLGAQANLWTEYIKYPSKVEYKLFPRLSALSEVLWTPKAMRNWGKFEKRLQTQFRRYELWDANYSRAYFDLKSILSPGKSGKGIIWNLKRGTDKGVIVYQTPDGKKNTVKTDSIGILINKPGAYSAWLSESEAPKSKQLTSPIKQKFFFNKATGKKVSISAIPNEKYPGQNGAFSLVNGVWSNKGLSYPDWLGWIGDDMEALIDMETPVSISTLKMHTLDQNGSWVYLPKYVEVLFSSDGSNFKSVGKSSTFTRDTLTMGWITVNFPKQTARYVKVVAKNYGLIPDGKPGGGSKAWLFADEILIQ